MIDLYKKISNSTYYCDVGMCFDKFEGSDFRLMIDLMWWWLIIECVVFLLVFCLSTFDPWLLYCDWYANEAQCVLKDTLIYLNFPLSVLLIFFLGSFIISHNWSYSMSHDDWFIHSFSSAEVQHYPACRSQHTMNERHPNSRKQ